MPHLQESGTPDTICTSPVWNGEDHHPDLTKTKTGCHVWRGSRYGPCFKHGTVGCCLIAHASPRSQQAHRQGRCMTCGRFLADAEPLNWQCHGCWAKENRAAG